MTIETCKNMFFYKCLGTVFKFDRDSLTSDKSIRTFAKKNIIFKYILKLSLEQ